MADALEDVDALLVKVYALWEEEPELVKVYALWEAEPVAEAVAVASADGVGGAMKENRTKPPLPSCCATVLDIAVAMLPHAPKPRPLT